jgi:hypothetical protein
MKAIYLLPIALLSVLLIVSGCEKEDNDSTSATGEVVNSSTCKNDMKSDFTFLSTPDTLSCVEFIFDETNSKLIIRHINAGFNCCPGNITCNVSQINDTIVIQEFEEAPLCSCLCLFDLDIDVNNITKQKYILKFVEPYATNLEPLIFEVNLIKDTEGSYCVLRKQYPWGQSLIAFE